MGAGTFEKKPSGRIVYIDHRGEPHSFSGDEDLDLDPTNANVILIGKTISVDYTRVGTPTASSRDKLLNLLADDFFNSTGNVSDGSPTTGGATETTLVMLKDEQALTKQAVQAVENAIDQSNLELAQANQTLEDSYTIQQAIEERLRPIEDLAKINDLNGVPLSITNDTDVQTSGIVEYALVAASFNSSNGSRLKLESLSAFVQTSDDYSIFVAKYDSEAAFEAALNGQAVSWSNRNADVRAAIMNDAPAQTFSATPDKVYNIQSRDINNANGELDIMAESGCVYVVGIKPHQTGSDSYISLNLRYYQ